MCAYLVPLPCCQIILTNQKSGVVSSARTVATTKPLPVQIPELSEAQYLVLLKHARNSSRVAARLLRVIEPETSARKGKVGPYLFTGFVTDALGLRAIAVVHAPDALPAIDRALKRVRGVVASRRRPLSAASRSGRDLAAITVPFPFVSKVKFDRARCLSIVPVAGPIALRGP